MYYAGILYARTGYPWPVPWQVLAMLLNTPNVSTHDLASLNFLRASYGSSNRDGHYRTCRAGSRLVYLFGSLEGLRVTGLLESTDLDQDIISPYLIPAGYEAEFLQQRMKIRGHGILADNLAASVSLVSYWLQKCILNHPECRYDQLPNSVSSKPRRMIDLINYRPSLEGSRVRVVESEWLDEPYCALSYRWPSAVASLAILTPQSKEMLYAGIHPIFLHYITRDACTLCHKLGFRYLWVDALCIMQGDGGDWHVEAQKISSIYLNATCTIASIDGTSLQTASGLASRPNLYDENMLQALTPTSDICTPEEVYMALEKSGNFAWRPNGELDTRCWTFQEKMLSRRIISITKDGVFWDCLHHSASGFRPTGILGDFSPNFRDTDDRKFKTVLLGRPSATVGTLSDAELYWYWRKAVQDYTTRNITWGRDRFIALQGIIAKFRVALDDDCILCIWRRNAARCLAWFVDSKPASKKESRTQHRNNGTVVSAPSWSWISVSHPIQYRLYHPFDMEIEEKTERVSDLISVQDLSMWNPNKYRFDVFAGQLRLRGAALKGLLLRNRVYIQNRTSSAPKLSELSGDGKTKLTSVYWSEILKRYGSSRTLDKFFFDTQFLADNVESPDPDAPTGARSNFLDDELKYDDQGASSNGHNPSRRQSEPPPLEVTCLLLLEGGYVNMLSARYFLVLSPLGLGQRTDIDIEEYFESFDHQPDSPKSFRRIGICAFDRQQICQSSAQHTLSMPRLCSCLGAVMTVDII